MCVSLSGRMARMVELMLRRGLVVDRSCNPCGMLPRSFRAELFCWRDRAASGDKSRVVGKRVCLFFWGTTISHRLTADRDFRKKLAKGRLRMVPAEGRMCLSTRDVKSTWCWIRLAG